MHDNLQTLPCWLQKRSPDERSDIRVLDPACRFRSCGLPASRARALVIDQIVDGPKFYGWLSANASISRAKASGAVNATQCPASGRIVTCLLPNA